jgi:hypothetical protein
MEHSTTLHAHIRRQEVVQRYTSLSGQSIERISHCLSIGIFTVTDATKADRIIANAVQRLFDAVLVIVGDHHEQQALEAVGRTFRNEQVCGPSTTTIVVLLKFGRLLGRFVRSVIPECPFVRNGHRGVGITASNNIFTWIDYKFQRKLIFHLIYRFRCNPRFATNRSISIANNRNSLKPSMLPNSFVSGSRKIRTIPSQMSPSFFTLIV